MNEDLDVYIASEQPETCRKCGTRVDIEEESEDGLVWRVRCHRCGYEYLVESDEEEE